MMQDPYSIHTLTIKKFADLYLTEVYGTIKGTRQHRI